jgi:hypothetical protein
MSDDAFKLRVVIAKEPGHNWPFIVYGISEDTWGVMPPEEWDDMKRKMCEEWCGPDWTINDFAEAVLDVPYDALRALFSPAIPVNLAPTEPDA